MSQFTFSSALRRRHRFRLERRQQFRLQAHPSLLSVDSGRRRPGSEWCGRVRRIGIRSSTLATFDGQVIVQRQPDRRRRGQLDLERPHPPVDIAVGVSYGSDPRAALAILDQVARAHAEVLESPAPMALFVGFGDSSLLFELRFWTPEYDAYIRVGSEVRTAIFAAFKEAGIEIPFPQRDLHVKSVTPDAGRALTQNSDRS
jgi:hypothetical protein